MRLICLIGESGSGKDTILNNIIRRCGDKVNRVVTYTTRPPRERETEGIEYHFVDNDYFEDNEFASHREFNGWHYGIDLNSFVEDKVNVIIVDPGGFIELCEIFSVNEIFGYIIHTSDKQRLLRQLNREQYPNCYEIARRFCTDANDFDDFMCYIQNWEYENVYVLDNENDFDLEDCILTIVKHIEAIYGQLSSNSNN